MLPAILHSQSNEGCIEMREKIHTDVLVIGAGLAGILAALSAAEEGVKVCITSAAQVCAGSSFYSGTWGLGVVSANSDSDKKDLEKTILQVGENMADADLVHKLVERIPQGILYLKQMNIPLHQAKKKEQAEFIPCFDHKIRQWHGFKKDDAKDIFERKLLENGVRVLEYTSVIELIKCKNRVCKAKAVIQNSKNPFLLEIAASCVIIATGGMSSLFYWNLNTPDNTAMGQYLALKAGAKLINIEFMQMMSGYIKPAFKTIYNEKMFQYTNFATADGILFKDWQKNKLQKCIKTRSTHGPFTVRLNSGDIDIELFKQFLKYPQGIEINYNKFKGDMPEFIQTYFKWLKNEKNIKYEDTVRIGIFAHASNGGIYIDTNAFTGVEGMYACGEASGGMHGADRIGGLSTANAIVYGITAGKNAAWNVGKVYEDNSKEEKIFCCDTQQMYRDILKINYDNAMILRSKTRSNYAIRQIDNIQDSLHNTSKKILLQNVSANMAAKNTKLKAALVLSSALHQSILSRQESRGAHFREDAAKMKESFAKPIIIQYIDKKIEKRFADINN